MKVDLQNYFTTFDEQYPKNRQGTLMLLEKYTKSNFIQQDTSEGMPLAQSGGGRNKQLPPYDKEYLKICNSSDAYKKVPQQNIVQEKYQYKEWGRKWLQQV